MVQIHRYLRITGRTLTVPKTVRKAGATILVVFNVLRACSTMLWLKEYVANGDAASSAHTLLAAVVGLGKILTGLDN